MKQERSDDSRVLLHTGELTVRRFEKKDVDDLYRLLGDPQIMRFLEPVFNREKTEAFLENYGLCKQPLIYAVDQDGKMIGYVIYHPYDKTGDEIGWLIAEEFQKKGYATKLTEALILDAAERGRDAIIECSPEQTASIFIAKKFSFVYEGEQNGCAVYRRKCAQPQKY